MAMEIKGPSGTVYTWTKATPPTPADMAALQAADQAKMRTVATAQPTPVASTATSAPTAPMANPRGQMSDTAREAAGAGMVGLGGAIGQFMGTPAGAAGMAAGGAIGGGAASLLSQMALTPPATPREIKWGKFLSDAGVSAVPGEPLANVGGKILLKEGIKYATANTLAKFVEKAVDEGGIPTKTDLAIAATAGAVAPIVGKFLDQGAQAGKVAGSKIAGAVEDATLAAGRKLGYVIPPTMVKITEQNPGMTNVALSAVAGPDIQTKTAIIKNQKATDAAARVYAGLAENTPLEGKAIGEAIKEAEKPYEALASLSPQAASNLQGMREANAMSKKYWNAYDRQMLPALQDQAEQFDALSNLYHSELKNEAAAAGKPELATAVDEARVKLAKLYMVDKAVPEGSGHASARVFGAALNSGKVPLTDEGLTIAKMANLHPQFVGPVTTITDLGKARIPMAGNAANAMMMSPAYQQFTNAGVNYRAARPDFLALFGRNATAAEGRR